MQTPWVATVGWTTLWQKSIPWYLLKHYHANPMGGHSWINNTLAKVNPLGIPETLSCKPHGWPQWDWQHFGKSQSPGIPWNTIMQTPWVATVGLTTLWQKSIPWDLLKHYHANSMGGHSWINNTLAKVNPLGSPETPPYKPHGWPQWD